MQEVKTSISSHCLPGITEIALKALSTLNVRRAEKLPRLTTSVTYLQRNVQLLWDVHNNEQYILAIHTKY